MGFFLIKQRRHLKECTALLSCMQGECQSQDIVRIELEADDIRRVLIDAAE